MNRRTGNTESVGVHGGFESEFDWSLKYSAAGIDAPELVLYTRGDLGVPTARIRLDRRAAIDLAQVLTEFVSVDEHKAWLRDRDRFQEALKDVGGDDEGDEHELKFKSSPQ